MPRTVPDGQVPCLSIRCVYPGRAMYGFSSALHCSTYNSFISHMNTYHSWFNTSMKIDVPSLGYWKGHGHGHGHVRGHVPIKHLR